MIDLSPNCGNARVVDYLCDEFSEKLLLSYFIFVLVADIVIFYTWYVTF